MADVDARAARLFVVATKMAAAGEVGEARALLQRAAEDGSPYAALELGIMMAAGMGGSADPEGGIAWVVRAAEAGVAAAAGVVGGGGAGDPGGRGGGGPGGGRRGGGGGGGGIFVGWGGG